MNIAHEMLHVVKHLFSDEEPIEDELVHIPVNLTIEDEDDEKVYDYADTLKNV